MEIITEARPESLGYGSRLYSESLCAAEAEPRSILLHGLQSMEIKTEARPESRRLDSYIPCRVTSTLCMLNFIAEISKIARTIKIYPSIYKLVKNKL
jgi:hypothetical protein